MFLFFIILRRLRVDNESVANEIGGSGFVGQHIVKHLQEKDDDVKEIRIVDLKPYSNKLRMLFSQM